MDRAKESLLQPVRFPNANLNLLERLRSRIEGEVGGSWYRRPTWLRPRHLSLMNYKYRLFPLLNDIHITVRYYSHQYAQGSGDETTSKIRPGSPRLAQPRPAMPQGIKAMDAPMWTPFTPPVIQQSMNDNLVDYRPYTLADDELWDARLFFFANASKGRQFVGGPVLELVSFLMLGKKTQALTIPPQRGYKGRFLGLGISILLTMMWKPWLLSNRSQHLQSSRRSRLNPSIHLLKVWAQRVWLAALTHPQILALGRWHPSLLQSQCRFGWISPLPPLRWRNHTLRIMFLL